jgi:hypothetical protein
MGKTVWLDLFCSRPGERLMAVKIDYEGVRNSEEFLLRTVQALSGHRDLPDRAREKFRALFENLDLSASAGPVTIRPAVRSRTRTDLLSEAMRSVDRHLADGTTLVVAMDEVPIAVGNVASDETPESAGRLLQTLRELRRRESKLRWIVSGSIGFHHVLRRCGVTEGVVNDLVNLPLGPLEDDEARELAHRLLLGIGRAGGDDVVDALVQNSGAIPFLIHHLAHHLEDSGSGPVNVAQVERAFVEFMDDRDESRAVTHLLTRLDPLYGDRVAAAKELLDHVARTGRVPTLSLQSDTDSTLLDDLIDDHYLIEKDGVVTWRYPVLQRIWVHRRRLG